MPKDSVSYQKSKNAYVAKFIDSEGNKKELYFSVSKYGDKAKQLAEKSLMNKVDIRNNVYIEHKNYYEIQIPYKGVIESVLIDKDDYAKVKQYKWRIATSRKTKYAITHANISKMHRLILNTTKKEVVDHINHNGLDNRKSNLRNVNISTNNRNATIRKDNSSGIQGVHLTRGVLWTAKWYDENNRIKTKSFSCNKYGYEEAKQMAIDFRESMVNQYYKRN